MPQDALPNAAKAVISRDKLLGYALSASHERGLHKARVFESALGINAENYLPELTSLHVKKEKL